MWRGVIRTRYGLLVALQEHLFHDTLDTKDFFNNIDFSLLSLEGTGHVLPSMEEVVVIYIFLQAISRSACRLIYVE